MDSWVWILIAAVVVGAVVGAGVVAAANRRKRGRLREGFGPEYERAVENRGGDRKRAEADLEDRRERRESFELRPLSAAARERYSAEWRTVQGRFVDEPVEAVGDADRLVTEVMGDQGYPMDDFDRQADVVSVDHPREVQDYREGHRIYAAHGRGEASTEDLRQAMVHYRALFDRLLGTGSDRDADRAKEAR